jgi:hypothetical protein
MTGLSALLRQAGNLEGFGAGPVFVPIRDLSVADLSSGVEQFDRLDHEFVKRVDPVLQKTLIAFLPRIGSR